MPGTTRGFMEFAESTDKEKPIPKELTAFLNEVQNNLGLYPETVIYNRIKEYISVIPRKQVAWLTQTVIISTEFRVRILSTRCKSGDKLACEMLDLAVNGDEYSKNPTVQKGLMGLFRDENDIESGKLLVEIGVITQEQYDKEIRSRKSGDLIDGKSYPDLLNDLAAESKKYPTADSFSMAMIMGKLESVPSPNTANVYKLIRGKYKTAEDFYNAVKKGEFELKKTEERKERMVEPEEAVSKPLVIKGVEDLELMRKEIKDKIDEEKRRRARGGGMAGEIPEKYVAPKKSKEWESGYVIAKDCFEHAAKTGQRCSGSAPYVYFVEALAWSIKNKEIISSSRVDELSRLLQIDPASEFNKGVYDLLMDKIWNYQVTGNIAGEPSAEYLREKLSELPMEERKKLIECMWTSLGKRMEPGKVITLDDISRLSKEEKIKAARILIGPEEKKKEVIRVYKNWTVDDFKHIISRTTDLEDLLELEKHISESEVTTPRDRIQLRQIVEQREVQIRKGGPDIRKQAEEQDRELKLAAASRLREDDRIQEPPQDYKLWTFADFEPFIYNEEDIDELGQLQGIVNLSNRLTETEKTELHELIDKQIGEILARR
jgi:hypothetical protein